VIVGCARCVYSKECGDIVGAYDFFGCHRVARETCLERKWTCPECDPVGFMVRSAEVRFRSRTVAKARAVEADLPAYIPNIHHARSWSGRLLSKYVGIPMHRLLLGKGQGYGPRFADAATLRRGFHLMPDAGVLLVGVADDRYLERYWRDGKISGLPAKLAALGVTAVTVANFSFFADAHRFHLRYNRNRITACLNELSDAGIAVVPHINALNREDRSYWIDWLKANDQVRHVCREFQTGNGVEQIEEIADIRDQIGRDLHPIIVGGASYVRDVQSLFRRSTIVDSQPFFKSIKAQRAVVRDGVLRWENTSYEGRPALGRLVRDNVAVYGGWIENAYVSGRQTSFFDVLERALRMRRRVANMEAQDPRQVALPLTKGETQIDNGERQFDPRA
jgi:hypothetical protein